MGERVFGRFSGRVEGWGMRFVRPICARSCLRRGDADASMMRLLRRGARMGWLKGRGARGGPGGCGGALEGDRGVGVVAASYAGGGSPYDSSAKPTLFFSDIA